MANKKVLFIDGQVFQSAAWDRGMGKYSLALLKYLVASQEYSYTQTYIIFTKGMAISAEVKAAIKAAAPEAKQIIADLQIPEDPCTADIASMQQANENILDELIREKTNGLQFDYLILSLFIDQVCSTFPVSASKKILLFYDLIPLQYVERYSKLCAFPNYLKRFKTLFEADLIWTISQTVADDVVINLGIDPRRVYNIDGAPIERQAVTAEKPPVDLPDRFILMPSGNDLRKNNLRAVQGFEEYRKLSGDNIALVLTSHFDDNTRSQLNAYSSELIFTGNVKEEELRWLYEQAAALLFVPEYEGLGLPILEGAEVDKPIVCSNIGVFNEMSTEAFYYCNQYDPISIGAALEAALTGTEFSKRSKLYPEILSRYSWPVTAGKALDCITYALPEPIKDKPRIAIFAPSPEGYSDIGKRVLQLHPAMACFFDIDYYVEHGKTTHRLSRADYLPSISRVYDAEDFDHNTYRQYDAVLYHLGNSEFHVETIKNSLYLPGFAVFHDTHMTNIFEGELSTYGYVSTERFDQEALLDTQLKNQNTSFLTSIANRQLGIITHSEYAHRALMHTMLEPVPSIKVNLPVPTPKQVAHKLAGEQLTIGFAGIIHPAKGLDIIETVAQSQAFFDCKIHIFGLSLVSDEVIRKLEAYPNVTVDTNVTDFEFQLMLREVDVLVNYRKDYRGETSAATLEAMRFGAIPIVRKVGWYDELPDDLVYKATSPEDVGKQLEAITKLSPAERKQISEQARLYVEKEFNYYNYAESVYEFIRKQVRPDSLNQQISELIRQGANLNTLLRSIDDGKK